MSPVWQLRNGNTIDVVESVCNLGMCILTSFSRYYSHQDLLQMFTVDSNLIADLLNSRAYPTVGSIPKSGKVSTVPVLLQHIYSVIFLFLPLEFHHFNFIIYEGRRGRRPPLPSSIVAPVMLIENAEGAPSTVLDVEQAPLAMSKGSRPNHQAYVRQI